MKAKNIFLFVVALAFLFACNNKKPVVENEVSAKLTVKSVKLLHLDGNEYRLDVEGNGDIKYEVYYSRNPYKIIIIANDAEASTDVIKYKYSDDNVESVVIYPVKDRLNIEILLNNDAKYKYSTEGNVLSVDFNVIKETSDKLEDTGMDLKDAEFVDMVRAKNLNKVVNKSDSSKILFNFFVDGIVRYDYGFINQKKLYVDLFDIKSNLRKKVFKGKGLVRNYKVSSYYPPQKVRVLIDLARPLPVFVGQEGNKLVVSSELSNVPENGKYIIGIENVNVNKFQSIIIQMTSKVTFEKKIVDGSLLIQFNGNVQILNGVNNVFTYENMPFKKLKFLEVNGKTSIIIEPNGDIYAKVEEIPEGLMINGSFDEFTAADYKIDEEVLAASKAESEKNKATFSKDDLISLNIKNLDVQEAVRLVYFGRGKNIVFGKGVKGKVTLYVKDIPYRQALDIIYKEVGLKEIEEDNNLIWVITKSRYESDEKKKLDLARQVEAMKKAAPLVTEILPVNYGNANDYLRVLQSIKTNRGKIQVEKRSNSFVVTDTQETISKMKETLKNLDKRTPQVTIESRIVEVLDSNDLNIGIQWGGQYTNNYTSYYFPHSIHLQGNSGTVGPSGNGYLVNLPVSNPAGALAMTLGTLANDLTVDVALSALETRNKTKTISSPKITTMDNEEAEIKSGGTAIIVPIGDNTKAEKVDVGIKLKVTPHITNNNMIMLEIEVEKSSLGEVNATTATTLEKKAKTQVLLADGETTVIGGIYENETTKIHTGVPFLMDIPVLGWLFKTKTDKLTKKELLVFITPKITR